MDLCPSINQSPIRATQRTDDPADPPASISSEGTPVVHTLRAVPAGPRLQSPLLGGEVLTVFESLFCCFQCEVVWILKYDLSVSVYECV